MKSILITLIIAVTLFYSFLWLSGFYISGNGCYIKKSTEQKYLRNIDKFYPISDRHITSGFKHSDSLTFAVKFGIRVPFQKWYLYDLGLVPVGSEIDIKLDSISDSYKTKFE